MDYWLTAVIGIVPLVVALVAFVQARTTDRRRIEFERQSANLQRFQGDTGPLRLYMFLCARAAVRWLCTYSRSWGHQHPWPMRADPAAHGEAGYHAAGPTIYRLLRPLTVSGLIVHRMHYADLAFDEPTVEIVRFNNAAFDILTREEITRPFELMNPALFELERAWSSWDATDFGACPPYQRMRDSYLRRAAEALIVDGNGNGDCNSDTDSNSESNSDSDLQTRRCMSHADFLDRWERDPAESRDFHDKLMAMTTVMDRFDPQVNPVFWLRLVAYAYACTWYLDEVRASARRRSRVNYSEIELPIAALMAATGEPCFMKWSDGQFREHFDTIIHEAL